MSHHANETLQQSEERFRWLSEATLEGIVIHDHQQILDVNGALTQMFGYGAAELVSMRVLDLIAPPSLHWVEQQLRLGYEKSYEAMGMRKDGSSFYVEIQTRLLRRFDSVLKATVIRDISDRKKTETRLLELTRLQSAILDSAAYLIISTDAEGIIQSFNATAQTLLGYAPEDVIGWSTPLIFHLATEVEQRAKTLATELGQPIEPGFEVFVAKARQGVVEEQEWTYIRKDRSQFPVLLSVTGLWDEDENIVGFLGIAKDITRQKQAEAIANTAESRFRRMVANVPGMIYQYVRHPDGCESLPFLGDNCAEIFEVSAATAQRNPNILWAMVDSDDIEPLHRSIVASSQTLQFWTMEWRVITPSGRVKWIQGFSRPERRSNGDVAWDGFILDISDRKATEAALQHSETTTQALLSAIPDLLIRMTRQGIYLNFISAKTFTALKADQNLIGQSIFDVLPPALAQQRMHYVERAIQTGQLQVYEYEIEIGDRLCYQEARITVCGTAEVLVIIRDISDRKQTEAELKRSRDELEMRVNERTIELQEAYQQLSHLIDNSPLAVIEWDSDFRIQGWSHQAEKVFGWKAAEVLGKSLEDWQFIYQDDRADVYQAMSDLKANKVAQIVTQNRNYTKDGRIIHCEWHESALIDGDGNLSSVLSIAQDITTRKQAEREVRLLQTITQAISEADNFNAALEVTLGKICQVTQWDLGEVWIPAADGSRLEISPAWYSSSDDLNEFRKVSETFVFPRDVGIPGRVWDTQQLEWYQDVSQLPADWFLRVRNAQQVNLKAALGIPIVANGTVVAVFLFFAFTSREFDENLLKLVISVASQLGQVIQRKKAEEALMKAHDELEMRVRQRTEELQNVNAYLQAEIVKRAKLTEQLKRSNQELEQFAYVASHDLQEPLRAITSYTQLLSKRYRGHLDERADKYINYVVDGAAQMQQLITDLLAYSRVGRHELKLELVDCNLVLDRALQNLKVAIAESNAVIRYDTLPSLRLDANQITQLLQNLISNAIKYCDKACPNIQITVAQKNEDWIFSIRDNGIGIESQYLERIFIIFQRLHTRGEYSGTGIGLAICKKIVERHKGSIWVESIPTQGSTFYFSLPKNR